MPAWLDFPGSNAGASLKPEPRRSSQVRPRQDFPGSNAGASLKLVVTPNRIIGHEHGLPRQQCRGLIEAWRPDRLLCADRGDFPGSNAGASLKHRVLHHAVGGRRRLPRQQCRGLIEAHPSLPWPRRLASGLPRQQCRGLIEAPRAATPIWRPSRLPRQQCRGLIEAWRSGRAWLAPMRLPRQQCRGLIEAARSPPRPPRDGRDFPGSNAGASLKLEHVGVIQRHHRHDFPGSNAGASLKRSKGCRWHRSSDHDFPGSNAGASLKRWWRDRFGCQSCRLPRQQCRGLIEASPLPDQPNPPGTTSPAAMPGPH